MRSWDGHLRTSTAAKSKEAKDLVYQVHHGCSWRYQIPANLKGLRTFILKPRDAENVERMGAYILDAERVPPVLDNEFLLDMTVTSERAQI